MDVFCQDTKLNLSPYYLRPGFAFGGSCLPKDLGAITCKAKELEVDVPVLFSVLQINHLQIERALEMVFRANTRRFGLSGICFKVCTDDLCLYTIVSYVESHIPIV